MKRRSGVAGALLALAALLMGGVTACGIATSSITVGAKDFTEQRILAEMLAQLAEADGVRVDRIVPYPADVSPYSGLQDGTIDVYVEYTGTGLLALGQPPVADSDLAFELVQEAWAESDIAWLPRLGFGNDYVLAVTPESAQLADLESISDLARAQLPPLRFATSTEYLRRPLDGLSALASRYGLALAPDVLATDDKTELYSALRSGDADVAVGFSTDPELADFDLTVLEDDLGFFPAYDAAPVARLSLVNQYPELRDTFASLEGRIDEDTMRALIAQVDVEQRDPAVVAREALIRLGLVVGGTQQERGDAVVVAIGLGDELAGSTGRAIEAIRAAYVGRPITVLSVEDPADAVVSGDARIAIADAETLFAPEDRAGGVDRPIKPLEAVAAVELRSVQVLADPEAGDLERVVVGGSGSTSQETAATLLATEAFGSAELIVRPGSTITERAEAVLDGEADAAIVVSPLGHPEVQAALNDGLVLAPLQSGSERELLRTPHLRVGQIPARAYAGLTDTVATLAQQTVVAGPAGDQTVPGIHGPGAFVGGPQQPLAPSAVASIRGSLSEPRVDPVLPRAPAPITDPEELTQPTNPSPATSVATVLVFLGLAALIWALLKPTAIAEDVMAEAAAEAGAEAQQEASRG
jgi:glycine betaine/choline ABC-type transport system substrate-binding protein